MNLDKRVEISWWVLRIALGAMAIIAGIDKYFNKLTDWTMYLGPLAKALPVGPVMFMHLVGVVEVIAGVIVLTRLTRVGAYIVMAWLIAIAINLVTTGMFYDLAVRDLELAVSAFVLAQLSAFRGRPLGSVKDDGRLSMLSN
jgi:uncharacterized membrane protein YphA (DoxX/SURF4 family)